MVNSKRFQSEFDTVNLKPYNDFFLQFVEMLMSLDWLCSTCLNEKQTPVSCLQVLFTQSVEQRFVQLIP